MLQSKLRMLLYRNSSANIKEDLYTQVELRVFFNLQIYFLNPVVFETDCTPESNGINILHQLKSLFPKMHFVDPHFKMITLITTRSIVK